MNNLSKQANEEAQKIVDSYNIVFLLYLEHALHKKITEKMEKES